MLTFVTFTGNGVTTVYSLPFPYINKYHVTVEVDGVDMTQDLDYTVSGSTLTFAAAPANASDIIIHRVTPRSTPLVTFVDGSFLSAANLNKQALQNLYVAQEVFENSLQHDTVAYDVDGFRVSNVGDPVDAGDAANKAYVDAGDAASLAAVAAASSNITTVENTVARWNANKIQGMTIHSSVTGATNGQPLVYSALGWVAAAQVTVSSIRMLDSVTGLYVTVTVQDGALAIA